MFRRFLAVAAIVATVGLVVLHTPPVRALVSRALVNAARERGIALALEGFGYNLFTLKFTADNVALAAADRPSAPFLHIQRVETALRPSALAGRLHFASLRLIRPSIAIVTGADGRDNLPRTSGGPSPGALPTIEIGRLAIERFAFKTQGQQAASFEIRDLSLDLQPTGSGRIEGWLVSVGAGRLAVRDQGFDVRVSGGFGLDATTLTVRPLELATTGASLRLDGSLAFAAAPARLDVNVRATLALEALTTLWPGLAPARGGLEISGRVTGPVARPELAYDARSRSPQVVVKSMPFSRLAVAGSLHSNALVIRAATANTAGGRVSATATIPIGREGAASVHAGASRVSARALAEVFAPGLPVAPGAAIDADVDARWDWRGLETLLLSGVARATPTGGKDGVALAGHVSFAMNGNRWALGARQRVGTATDINARLRGVFDIAHPALTTIGGHVSISAAAADVRDWLARIPAVRDSLPDLAAAVQAELEAAGSVKDPRAKGTLALGALQARGRAGGEATARVGIDRKTLALDDVLVSLGASQLRGTVALPLDGGPLSANFAASIDDLASWIPTVDQRWLPRGRVAAKGTLGGRIAAPTLDAAVSADRLDWRGFDTGPMEGDVHLDGGRLSATLRVPALNAALQGSATLASSFTYDATCELEDADLARFEAMAVAGGAPRWQVEGRTRLRGRVAGTFGSPPRLLEAEVTTIDALVEGHRVRLRAPTRVTWSADRLAIAAARVEAGGLEVTADGALSNEGSDTALRITAQGRIDEWVNSLFSASLADRPRVSGQASVSFVASGTFEQPTLSGQVALTEGKVGVGEAHPIEEISLRGSLQAGIIEVTEASAAWAGAKAHGRGRIPLGVFAEWLPPGVVPASTRGQSATLRGELASVSGRSLVPILGQAAADELAGHLSASFEVEAPVLALGAAKGSVVVSHGALTVAGLPVEQVRPVTVRLAHGRVTVEHAAWTMAGQAVTVKGHVDLEPAPRLDLSLAGTIDLAASRVVLPFPAGGLATVDLRASGSTAAPSLSGTATLEDGWLRIAEPKVAVSTVAGRLTFSNDHVQVTAKGLANGGTVELDGIVPLRGGTESRRLHLVGRDFAIEWPTGLRSTVDATLTYRSEATERVLSGRIEVTPGAYRRAAMPKFGGGAERGTRQAASPLDATALDLSVVTRSGAVLDNSYARVEVDAQLHVGGTVGRPVVGGRLRAKENGQVFVRGNVFALERGMLEFDPKRGGEPSLQLAAQTRRAGYDIRLIAAGPLDEPSITLTSDPPLSQTDLLSLVTTGSTSNSMSPASHTSSSNAAAAAVSSDVLGLAGRSLGLDTVRVGQLDLDLLGEDVDPQNRLTIGKSIRGNIDLLLSQDLREQGLTWVVTYRPLGNVEIRAVSRDAESRSLELRHEVVFGGTAATKKPRPTPAAPPPSPTPTIASVTASGSGLGQREILAVTSLQRGERFDFFAWQRDREAIQQMLADRGYLEAQVVARRDLVAGGAQVNVSYEVRPGRMTRLQINGFDLPGEVVKQLRRTWAEAVDDRFRLSDMREHARRAMVDLGYLWATTTAEVVLPADGSKTIALTVLPGAHAANRRVVFEGQAALTAGQLEQELVRRGLLATVWRDPSPAIDALVQAYRERGYLQASVKAAPIVREGDTGRLPISIAEGPRVNVGAIAIRGTDAAGQALVTRLLGFNVGAPYNPAEVARADRRIEAGLRSEGYPDAQASVKAALDAAGRSATITAEIQTGRRSVIAEVATAGNEVTSDGVIRRALKLPAGTVATPSVLDAAQRRLYEMDAFRGVHIGLEPLPSREGAAEQPVRATIALQEAPLYRLRYGLQVTDELVDDTQSWETRPGLSAELRRRNLFGSGLGVTGGLRVDSRRQSLRGAVSIPSSVMWPAVSTLFLKLSREPSAEAEKADIIETSITYQDRWRLGRRLEWSYGYSLTASHFVPKATVTATADDSDRAEQYGRRADLYTALVRDTRDNAFNASRGLFSSSSLEYGAPALGSDFTYVRVVLQGARYLSAGPFVLAGGATFGALVHVTGNPVLTYPIRFRAGGDRSVRGYATESLYPEGQSDEFGGGNALVVVNGEVRFPIWRWLKGATFVDAGNAFIDPARITLSGMKVGTGFGIRLDTPYALFRFDLGFPVSNPPGARSGRFYFSIGQAF